MTRTAIIIGCSKRKMDIPCSAKTMYSKSNLFNKSLSYAKSYLEGDIFILSAKYGILSLGDVISPYDMTMLDIKRGSNDYNILVRNISENLGKYDNIISLCGKKYVDILKFSSPGCNIIQPLAGMGIGKRMKFLSEQEA